MSDPAAIDPAPTSASAPIPVLPLEYAPPQAGGRIWRRILAICLPASYGLCLLAVILIGSVDVESVLFTGPALFAAGLLMLVASVFTRDRIAGFVATCHCAICLLFVALVNVLHWGPQDARNPFLSTGGIYTVFMLLPTYLAWVPFIPWNTGAER